MGVCTMVLITESMRSPLSCIQPNPFPPTQGVSEQTGAGKQIGIMREEKF